MPDIANFEQEGTTLTIKPIGQLDTATSPKLQEAMEPKMDGVTDVIMDFAEVDYISSGGLRLVLLTEQQMEKRNGTLKIIHVNDHVRSIFSLAGFLSIINIA